MKELFDARAELAHLQRREGELVKELLDVHKAVAKKKLVIDELIKASTIPHVNRLPNELLAQIFLLLSHERESLANVSRRWRAVIMDTPIIWSDINLRRYEGRPTLLKLHLERSRQIPLTVSLHDDQPELDVILHHVDRIRALRIFGGAPDILNRFASLTFPALEFLLVDLNSGFVDLLPSLYSRTPALKCLRLHGLREPLLPADPATGHPSSSTPRNMYPVESLTELSLRGAIDDWRLTANSIHFPVLESLALRINYPVSFLEAIVAPKLERFEFSRSYKILPIHSTFNGPTPKFDNVRQLICSASPHPEMVWQGALDLAKEFCYVFPGVQHARIHMQYLCPLFFPCRTVHHPHDHHSPIDNWTRLETLEIQDLDSNEVDMHFMDWFTKRREGLRLKLVSERTIANNLIAPDASNAAKYSLYQTFQECCASVGLCCIPVSSPMYISMSAGSLQLFTHPHSKSNQLSQNDLVALARVCSAEPADMLRAHFCTP
ncbi:hypothetical protein EDD16DRAFT_69445 [Pisolithus croceorrhizus]|nr:hypothetical protein EDD16DRAFT_69445 [Pisolithus croceorrhizus]KAI6149096.1 hypothetical protein EDD17DRAFT_1857132 [Pisolithus thermaeus]